MNLRNKLFKSSSVLKDEVAKYNKTTKHFRHSNVSSEDNFYPMGTKNVHEPISPWAKYSLLLIILLSIPILLIRLFHLQIFEGNHLRSLADSNRIVVKVIHAPRGVIYDRNGAILAQNEPGFRLNTESTESAHTRYLSRDEALKLEINNDPAYKNLEIDNLRAYPHKEITAHALGYVSEITSDELKMEKYKNYLPGDRIGRSGVEQQYESTLKGIDGGEIIEIDASGNKLRTLGKTDPIPGQNVKLSLDLGLQTQTYQVLSETIKKANTCCGASISTDPRTGEILALVSIPSFDPTNISIYFTDPTAPLLNRTIAGTYPPGSTFKIATALSGLESGKITPDTRFEDTGVYALGPYTFANWFFTQYGSKESGLLDVTQALKRSNDIFFYHLGELTGEKIMGDWAIKLGFGRLTGIDIPGEAEGLIPNNEWKLQNTNEVWYPGDSLHMAIGQGFVLATPIQVHQLVTAIASNDKTYAPHIGYQIVSGNNQVIKKFEYSASTHHLNSEYINLIKQGLSDVTKAGGTAWPFFSFPIDSAGKTGTAEIGDPKNRTHAWYTGYAPTENPKIATTVLVERGGEGSSIAAPVVKEVFRYFFSPDKKNLIKDLYQTATPSARQGE